jgi:hypothetical protein
MQLTIKNRFDDPAALEWNVRNRTVIEHSLLKLYEIGSRAASSPLPSVASNVLFIWRHAPRRNTLGWLCG